MKIATLRRFLHLARERSIEFLRMRLYCGWLTTRVLMAAAHRGRRAY
jgi:hypothetical protein